MPRQAQPKDNTSLEMAIVGYQSELEKLSAKIADIKAQTRSRRPRLAKGRGNRNGSRQSTKAAHDKQGWAR
jgi:hypothetical protein